METVVGRGERAFEHGEAKNSWLTGTALWNFVVVSQYLLGVRPDWDGLVVDPCLSPDLPEFSVTRKARGATYIISVKNSGGKGAKLTVDGIAIEGNQIPYAKPGSTVQVTAVISWYPTVSWARGRLAFNRGSA